MAKESFRHDEQLETIVQAIRDTLPFREIHGFRIVTLFSDSDRGRNAGYCRLLAKPVREATGVDYVIVIREPIFEALTHEQKARLLIHELLHVKAEPVTVNAGKKDESTDIIPKVRRHSPNFCTFAQHDHPGSLVSKTYESIKGEIRDVIETLTVASSNQPMLEEFLGRET